MSPSKNYKPDCRLAGYVIFDYDALFSQHPNTWIVDFMKKIQFHFFIVVFSFMYSRETVVSMLLDAGVKRIPLVEVNDDKVGIKEHFFIAGAEKMRTKFQKDADFIVTRDYGSFCSGFNVLQIFDKM